MSRNDALRTNGQVYVPGSLKRCLERQTKNCSVSLKIRAILRNAAVIHIVRRRACYGAPHRTCRDDPRMRSTPHYQAATQVCFSETDARIYGQSCVVEILCSIHVYLIVLLMVPSLVLKIVNIHNNKFVRLMSTSSLGHRRRSRWHEYKNSQRMRHHVCQCDTRHTGL